MNKKIGILGIIWFSFLILLGVNIFVSFFGVVALLSAIMYIYKFNELVSTEKDEEKRNEMLNVSFWLGIICVVFGFFLGIVLLLGSFVNV